MGYVYLIGEENEENKYKIGSTKCKDINKRLKQLQTGNSNQLYIKAYYETSRPFRLETMLHNKFKEYNVIGEWFELNKDDIESFESVCHSLQNIIDCLKENPYF
jgi:hypothetical protein